MKKTPKALWDIARELDAIADKVLAYRPKPKTKVQKSRKRRAKKAQRESKLKLTQKEK